MSKDAVPALDGLRGLACLLVIHTHLSDGHWVRAGIETGTAGVMLFFALSGYLMAHHYLPGERSLRYWSAFLVRRFFRIWPAYFAAALMIWVGSRYVGALQEHRGHTLWDLALLQHLTKLNRPFWTIIIELKFYLIFCAIAAAALWLKIPERKLPQLWALIALVFFGLAVTGVNWPYNIYFVGGAYAAVIAKMQRPHRTMLWNALVVFYLALLAFYIGWGLYQGHFAFPDYENFKILVVRNGCYFAPAAILALYSVRQSTGAVNWLFSNGVMRFTGIVSYSLYLTHVFVMDIFDSYITTRDFSAFLLLMVATLAVTLLFYVTVEKPAMQLGKHLAKKIR